jgi:hypothetical protein
MARKVIIELPDRLTETEYGQIVAELWSVVDSSGRPGSSCG